MLNVSVFPTYALFMRIKNMWPGGEIFYGGAFAYLVYNEVFMYVEISVKKFPPYGNTVKSVYDPKWRTEAVKHCKSMCVILLFTADQMMCACRRNLISQF